MKKLVLITLAFVTITLSAQTENHHTKSKKDMMEKTKDWTPEQHAELATKKLTLDLGLTESQQQKIYPIHLEKFNERAQRQAKIEKNTAATSSEVFDKHKARLEKKIKTKEQFKAILTADQFEKWEHKNARHRGPRKGKRPHKQ